jgi:hypothetical protein
VVRRALKILADREVTPQTGLLKSTLLQLDSTFSERNYGASSFLDFVEKMAKAGYVHLKTSGRSVMVELNESFVEGQTVVPEGVVPEGEEAAAAPVQASGDSESGAPPQVVHAFRPAESAPAGGGGFTPPQQEPVGPPLGDQADGVQKAGRILGAATGARWPMYLRNVKQILRQADGGFDERRYGFGGLMDLLKACQREGFVRVERDRRGGLRVFQGSALQQLAPPPQVHRPNLPQPDVEDTYENQPIDVQPPMAVDAGEPADSEADTSVPIPIDTTAELLGRAKPRKPRARAARPILAVAPKKAAAKKPAAKKTTRSKKSSQSDDVGNR